MKIILVSLFICISQMLFSSHFIVDQKDFDTSKINLPIILKFTFNNTIVGGKELFLFDKHEQDELIIGFYDNILKYLKYGDYWDLQLFNKNIKYDKGTIFQVNYDRLKLSPGNYAKFLGRFKAYDINDPYKTIMTGTIEFSSRSKSVVAGRRSSFKKIAKYFIKKLVKFLDNNG